MSDLYYVQWSMDKKMKSSNGIHWNWKNTSLRVSITYYPYTHNLPQFFFLLTTGKKINKFNAIFYFFCLFQVCGWNWFLIFNFQFILHTEDCTHSLNSVMSFWLFLWGRAFTHSKTYILETWAYYIDWRNKETRKTRKEEEEKENVKCRQREEAERGEIALKNNFH